MKSSFILVGVFVVVALVGIGIFVTSDAFRLEQKADAPIPQPGMAPQETSERYMNDDYGVSFSYPKGYYLREHEAGTSDRQQTAVVLVEDTQENRDLLDGTATEPREGPPSITVDLYQNPEKLSAKDWIAHDTNWNKDIDVLSEVVVGGKPGVAFPWDGLYAGRSMVITSGDKAYVFSVTWMTSEDQINKDFAKMLSTVSIAP